MGELWLSFYTLTHKTASCNTKSVMGLKCNLNEQKYSLHNREGDFNSRITVEVAHVAGNLEDVHDETEKPEQQKSS